MIPPLFDVLANRFQTQPTAAIFVSSYYIKRRYVSHLDQEQGMTVYKRFAGGYNAKGDIGRCTGIRLLCDKRVEINLLGII